jgi:hypothetical protein
MEKPGDGIRMVYMPKDSNDFNYYQITKNKAKNNGSRAAGEVLTFPSVNTLDPIDMQTGAAST